MSSLECEIEGKNFRDAANSAYKIIAPSLSQMSFQNDVPIFVSSVSIMELNTSSSRFFFLSDGKKKVIKRQNAFSLDPEIRAYLAIYREAQNANTSTFYQLFCYFKIIDGINKNRGLKKEKITIQTLEIVPDKYVHKGKKFSWVKNLVSKKFRNELAHFNFANGNLTMNPDDMDNLFECVLLLPELQYISRTMIKNEMCRKEAI